MTPQAARNLVKLKIIETYEHLFLELPEKVTHATSHNTRAGKEIVHIARQKLGYSRKSGNGDIFWMFYLTWKQNRK